MVKWNSHGLDQFNLNKSIYVQLGLRMINDILKEDFEWNLNAFIVDDVNANIIATPLNNFCYCNYFEHYMKNG